MAEKVQKPFAPQTPGEVLKQYVLNIDGVTQDVLAEAMDVSRLTVNQLLNDKRNITAEMALRLSRVLSTTPEFWLNLQQATDLDRARRKLAGALPKLRVLRRPQTRTAA